MKIILEEGIKLGDFVDRMIKTSNQRKNIKSKERKLSEFLQDEYQVNNLQQFQKNIIFLNR